MVDTIAPSELIEAYPEDVGISSARLENLSRKIQAYVDAGTYPGAITAVVRRGQVVHFRTYGSMDDEAGKPMAADTIFRIYSMTKPIVSLGLMLLYEEGKFQLDDPASKYIPQFRDLKVFAGEDADSYEVREPSREMTVRDLLMHMSGITSGRFGPRAATPVQELYSQAGVQGIGTKGTLADLVEKLAKLPLAADPGTTWIYGQSTDLVGYLCEVLSGQPLDRFLQERILGPLGMIDTHFYLPAEKLPRLAANYTFREDGPGYKLLDAPATSEFANTSNTYFSGVGGLLSTAPDYLRFVKMLANEGELDGTRLIGPRTLELMTLSHIASGGDVFSTNPSYAWLKGQGFGLGFAVLLDPVAAGILGTPGEFHWSGAASTHFFVSPADELAVVFMTQFMGSGPPTAIGRDLRVAVYQALTD